MRVLRTTLALALTTFATIAPAWADRASYHAVANGDIAFTDNVFSERRGNQDGDLFFQIRPGILLTYGMPRMIHDLNAEAEVTQYALHSEEASVTGRGAWRAFFLPSPRSEVILSANGGSSRLSALTTRNVSDTPILEVQPLGAVDALTADGSQYFSYVLTRELRFSQGLFARASRTDDNADDPMTPDMDEATIVTSREAGARMAIDRDFRMNSISLELAASVLRLERVAPEGAAMGSRLDRQINPRVRAQWRHDLDRKVSTSIDGGVVYVYPYGNDPYNPDDDGREAGYFPIVGAALNYTDVWGVAQMSIRRDVQPNLFVGQNTVNDSAVISAAMPLPWKEENRRRAPKLVGIGSIGVSRTQLVDPKTSDLASSIGVGRIDVGIMYAVKPGLSWGVRYELLIQTGDDRANPPIQGFFRNSFYFTFKVRYPEDVAAQVPKRRQNAVRADRKDIAPLGAEPVVPDLLDEGGEGSEGDR